MTAPFGPREFQLVRLRRMADHQPGLVQPPGPELRTVEDLRPWSGTVDEVARAFAPARPMEGGAPARWALAITAPGTGEPYVAEFARGLLQRLLPG